MAHAINCNLKKLNEHEKNKRKMRQHSKPHVHHRSASQSHVVAASQQIVQQQQQPPQRQSEGLATRPSHRRSFSYSAAKTSEFNEKAREDKGRTSFPLQVLDVFRRSLSYSSSLVGLGHEGADWEACSDENRGRARKDSDADLLLSSGEELGGYSTLIPAEGPEVIVVPNHVADDGLTHRSVEASLRRFQSSETVSRREPGELEDLSSSFLDKQVMEGNRGGHLTQAHSSAQLLPSSPGSSSSANGWVPGPSLLAQPFRMVSLPHPRRRKKILQTRRRTFEGLSYRSVTRPLLICFFVTLVIHLLNCYRAVDGGWQPSMCPF